MSLPALPRCRAFIALLGLAFGAGAGVGCSNGGTGPTQPNPPHAYLDLPETNVIGDTLAVNARTNGCDQVKSLTLLNGGQTLKTLSPATGTVSVFLHTADLSFTAGIPAVLALSLDVVCNDGRKGSSDVVGASFFPAVSVFAPAGGAQAVPDVFYAEGSGANVTFVGCALQSNGNPELVRVDTQGNVLQQNISLPFTCDDSTSFTDPAAGGIRWMLTPGRGALAFDSHLAIKNVARPTLGSAGTTPSSVLPASYLAVDPSGEAYVWSHGDPGPFGIDLYRVPLTPVTTGFCAPNVWCVRAPGAIGNPIVTVPFAGNSVSQVTLPVLTDNMDGATSTLEAWHFQKADGGTTVNALVSPISTPAGSGPPALSLTFDPTGTDAFFTYNLATPGNFAVRAVYANQNDAQKWENANLKGTGYVALPYGLSGNHLAAIADVRTYFLNPMTGVPLGAAPIEASPGLTTTMVQGGKAGEFYLLNGVAPKLPNELVAVDAPDKGELFRLNLPGGSLGLALDDTGQPWLRVGAALVKPLTLAQYRALRGP